VRSGTLYTPTRENHSRTSSHANPETLAAREVLAHPRVMFDPFTYGLHRGDDAVAAVLIDYDDVELLHATTSTRR
jgi:hypothetical protein